MLEAEDKTTVVTESANLMRRAHRTCARMLCVSLACGLLLQTSPCTPAEYDIPEEKPWVEREVTLPPVPRLQNMIRFDPGLRNSNRYYIDPQSISVADDGVVRYTMLIQGAGGAENVSYEGIRCRTLEHKFYAFGRKDGTWNSVAQSAWRQVDNRTASVQLTLWSDYFCPERSRHGIAPKEAIDRFKNGVPHRELRER